MKKAFVISERLYFRPLEKEDLDGPYGDWVNDTDVNHYLETGYFPVNQHDLGKYYQENIESQKNILFAICLKDSDRHIGNLRLSIFSWITRKCCRGIMLGDKRVWAKGYALEVINLLSKYVFETLNLNKIYSVTVADNAGIIKVNERAGYKQEGRLRQEFYRDGHYYDMIYWGLLKEDWLNMNSEKQ